MGVVVKVDRGKCYTLFITLSDGSVMRKFLHVKED